MSKRIALFNHKGGVSKTTTAFHLGWKLAEKGHRVLLVDGDSQCNLSQYFLGNKFDEFYEDEITSKDNIMDGVSAAFMAKPEPIKYITCPNNLNQANLFLLAGNQNLSEHEASLSLAQTTSAVLPSLQNLLGAFHKLISVCEEKYDISYTIIDMNPSLSSINQNLFCISDFFIIPTNPDPFSKHSVSSLSKIIPKWSDWANSVVELTQSSVYPFPAKQPKFLGEIIQKFNIRNGRAAGPFKFTIEQLKSVFLSEFYPALRKKSLVLGDDLYELGNYPGYCIAEIPDFQSLVQQSHLAGKPVFALDDTDFKDHNGKQHTGTVLEGELGKRQDFNLIFENIAELIVKRTA